MSAKSTSLASPAAAPVSPVVPPSVLVIFGVTGNLAAIKLLPAIHQLIRLGNVPDSLRILGVARKTDFSTDAAIEKITSGLRHHHIDTDPATIQTFRQRFTPVIMDPGKPEEYGKLAKLLQELDYKAGQPHQRLYYLAVPPNLFRTVLDSINAAGLGSGQNGLVERILVEKPLGTNHASALSLIDYMGTRYREDQIYRIDHYLAKETAQNILTFRFNNPIIEGIWSRQFIDHIQITAAETIGIEGRSDFYENMGALRDFVQSHLLQLLVLTTMEVPESMDAEHIHAEKLAVLQAIQPVKPLHVDEVAVRGQYKGYAEETGNPGSTVETFMALKLEVSNSRWGGVPILLRTGKALASKMTEISVVFRDRTRRNVPANILTIRIQPDEGITLGMIAKKPGFKSEMQPVAMRFSYESAFQNGNPDAYERVIADAIAGEKSLFATSEEVLRSWEILDPILHHWQRTANRQEQPPLYDKGSWGPACSDEFAQNYGVAWLDDRTR